MEGRWLEALNGIRSDRAAGEYDLFVTLAARFHWTPEQIMEMSPDYLDELSCYLKAEFRKLELDRRRLEEMR
ncbi:MAG: hypothetical protein IAE79_02900 [Anaerolinea sp.]|nr:hypothetical protein [Anaerolinea sp.]